jgi:hypothetical protein
MVTMYVDDYPLLGRVRHPATGSAFQTSILIVGSLSLATRLSIMARELVYAALCCLALLQLSAAFITGHAPLSRATSSNQRSSCLSMRAQTRAGKHGPALKGVGRAQRTLRRMEDEKNANK